MKVILKKPTGSLEQMPKEKWEKLTFIEQMANIGSEVGRALKWRDKDKASFQAFFDYASELLWLTTNWAHKNDSSRLEELIWVRSALEDFFAGENQYQTSAKFWEDYFLAFGIAARLEHERRYARQD